MDFELAAIALGDVGWIALAFLFGLAVKQIALPPMVGFLIAGFFLHQFGIDTGATLGKLADLGITLLLFTVGLKLNIRSLLRPQIWAVASFQGISVTLLFALLIYGLALLKLPLFEKLDIYTALLIALAMSFSSTVFVVKLLEDKGDMQSYHGRIAIGILIMQDLFAVGFLAATSGKIPSPFAIALFALIPLRPLFYKLLLRCGHGELLILYGLVLALGGAELFDMVGVKGDLGALAMGVLIGMHGKSSELAKSMLGFKDLFLVGFFLSIGLSGSLSVETAVVALLFVPLLAIKSGLFFLFMSRFRLRARTSLLSAFNLTNYSEFGLIVMAVGVAQGWVEGDWLIVMALALSFSFILSAPLNRMDNHIYHRFHRFWLRFQNNNRLSDDYLPNISDKRIIVFGMGRVGTGAYDRMVEQHGDIVVGFDITELRVAKQQASGRAVYVGDPGDEDFWEKLEKRHSHIELIMLALPSVSATLSALEQIRYAGFEGEVAVTAKYPDEEEQLREAGASEVFNFYTEAGAGFAEHLDYMPLKPTLEKA